MPQLNIGGQRLINVIQRMEDMLRVPGEYLHANNAVDTGFNYQAIFMNNRALMMIGLLQAADMFRAIEIDFGVLPMPKYDEGQRDYYSFLGPAMPLTVVPTSSHDPEFAGAVMDAMAYMSYKDVTPIFFDMTVSHKQLRNDDSIEMLQIIRNNSAFDIGYAYGWTANFQEEIRSSIGTGGTLGIASHIERNIGTMQARIEQTIDLFES